MNWNKFYGWPNSHYNLIGNNWSNRFVLVYFYVFVKWIKTCFSAGDVCFRIKCKIFKYNSYKKYNESKRK